MPSKSTTAETLSIGIQLRDLVVEYAPGKPVLQNLTQDIFSGEIVACVGASGCGKSTLLRAIAKLIPLRSGSIVLHPNSPTRRPNNIAYVFQDATLLPWRTVAENVKLPFELGRAAPRQVKAASASNEHMEIKSVLETVGLSADDAGKFPRELSGGMRMRVSLARAIVTSPSILLLDEPFAALDDLLRSKMNDLVLQLQQSGQQTVLFVTHNIAEAVFLSHRVFVLGDGKICRTLNNPLAFPRSPEIRSSLEFAEFYGRISHALAEVSP